MKSVCAYICAFKITMIHNKDYSFLDQAVKDSEHGLDSIPMDSVNTPELYASSYETEAWPSSVSSWFLLLVSTILENSRLQLAPSIRSHELSCLTRTLLLPIPQAGKMSASQLI